MKDKLFDAFISTKDQGRGLGLSYVAGAVASMEGDVEVISRAGLTEFQLRLPCIRQSWCMTKQRFCWRR